MLVIQDFNGKIDEEQARAILKESAELGNLLHDEEEETNGNSGKKLLKRYKPSYPQVSGDQPPSVIGLRHGHKPAPGRPKIKIAGTSQLLGKGSWPIISDEEIDELA